MKYKLIEPNNLLRDSFFSMLEDYNNHNEKEFPKYYDRNNDTFDDYIKKISDFKNGQNLYYGMTATTTYWLIDDDKNIIGTIRFRKELNDYTKNDGGNIGYDICPSFRNKKYGNLILKLLKEELMKLNSNLKLLLTCEVDNIPSNKIVIKNGGIFKDKQISKRTGKEINHYWLYINMLNTAPN